MNNFLEKYQGYILAGVAQVGTGIVIAIRLAAQQLGPIDDWDDDTP